MARPIWKDTFALLNNDGDTEQFRIRTGGSTIYSGRAYPIPNNSNVEVRVNDIAANYVKIRVPWFQYHNLITLDTNPTTFDVEGYVNGAWVNAETDEFFYDWSYDPGFNPAVSGIALPINGRMCDGMVFTYSVYQQAAVFHFDLYQANGNFLMSLTPSAVTDATFPFSGTLTFDVSQILYTAVQTARMEVQGVNYYIVPSCHRFALYYLNEVGGWDFLLIEGNYQVRDDVKRWTKDVVFENSTDTDRGRVTYAEEIVRHYTLYTGNMTDDESGRMHHLLNSPDVWLLDMETGRYQPVVLTNTETPYKTFVSEGRTMYVYEINCETANYMERR